MEALIKRLKNHEGLTLTVKPDRGKWVIGYGHQCSDNQPPITIEEAVEFLLQDVYKASDQYLKWKYLLSFRCTKPQGEVLVELIFWHGFRGFLKFKKMIAAIKKKDWDKAADEMMDSQSGENYPTRMQELADIMRIGENQ